MQNYNISLKEGFLKNKKSYINIFTTTLVSKKIKLVGYSYQISSIWYFFNFHILL
jgi:hypothetical protein